MKPALHLGDDGSVTIELPAPRRTFITQALLADVRCGDSGFARLDGDVLTMRCTNATVRYRLGRRWRDNQTVELLLVD